MQDSLTPEQPPSGGLSSPQSASAPECGAQDVPVAHAASEGPSEASSVRHLADEPLDIDRHWPQKLSREDAIQRLEALVPDANAQAIWTELIAPLYDARQFAAAWQQGHCRRCRITHPEYPSPGAKIRDGKHRMNCPKYVGPLEHRKVNGHQALMGWNSVCSCGQSYRDDVWDEPRAVCPDAAIDWRGPRPAGAPDA